MIQKVDGVALLMVLQIPSWLGVFVLCVHAQRSTWSSYSVSTSHAGQFHYRSASNLVGRFWSHHDSRCFLLASCVLLRPVGRRQPLVTWDQIDNLRATTLQALQENNSTIFLGQ